MGVRDIEEDVARTVEITWKVGFVSKCLQLVREEKNKKKNYS